MEYKGFEFEITQDEDAPNPREEFDNLGVMVCWHGRYDLGDVRAEYYQKSGDAFVEWADENAKQIALILPLYLYDHSGLRIKVGNFNGLLPEGHAEWDTMQVGFIYVTKEALREEYGCKRISAKTLRKAEGALRAEVGTYDQYLSGDVWGYAIEALGDSCWGFFGYDYCETEAKSIVDWALAHGKEPPAKDEAMEDEDD
jgi:hypothetical protein